MLAGFRYGFNFNIFKSFFYNGIVIVHETNLKAKPSGLSTQTQALGHDNDALKTTNQKDGSLTMTFGHKSGSLTSACT